MKEEEKNNSLRKRKNSQEHRQGKKNRPAVGGGGGGLDPKKPQGLCICKLSLARNPMFGDVFTSFGSGGGGSY